MILLCGIPSEPPLALALAAARDLGVQHVLFNQRHVQFNDAVLDVRGGRVSGALWTGECEYALDEFRGVYTRMVESATLVGQLTHSPYASDPRLVDKAMFLDAVLNEWFEVAACPVLAPASAAASNASKPYQAQLIAAAGFRTPSTLVTSDDADVREFVRTYRRVVYKSVSSVRSIVHELSPELDDARLARVRDLPTQFQELIEGTDVRVHVVGAAVFATEVRCVGTDYRYADRDGLDVELAPVTLPPDVAERCVALSRRLSLPFCGIDLRRTPTGEYVCFEVNPSPAYSYYEGHTAQPIATALVRYLAGQEA